MKNKKITVLDIVKSKLSSKEDLPYWYEKRLSICASCDYNSDNKPKSDWTDQEKRWVSLNQGNATCLACKCEISAKASLPHAVCGLQSIGLEPKWRAIETVKETSNIVVQNISTTDVKVEERNYEIWVEYPELQKGADTDVQFLIKDVKDTMTDISTRSSCGCTVPKVEKNNKEILLQIKYNTNLVGDFTKTVILEYKQNNIDYQRVFKITGKILDK